MKAMILAAGLGTRLRPLTDNRPKALVEVAGKPLLEHLILKLKKAGFDELVVNVHHFPNQIIDFLSAKQYFGLKIHISDERQRLLDTGGALKRVGELFHTSESLLVHNVDILSNVDLKMLYDVHTQNENMCISTLLVSERETSRYLLFDESGSLKGWTNIQTGEIKPTQDLDTKILLKKAFTGIQVISPSVFSLMENVNERFSIIDFYMKYCERENICSYEPRNLEILDIGRLCALEKANEFLFNF